MSSPRALLLFFAALLGGTHALMAPAVVAMRTAGLNAAPARVASVDMTSVAKKAKAAVKKLKSSSAVSKRFKATATGKLLRHCAGKAHILTKKHPQRKQKLRRMALVPEGQLKTMQKLMLVVPKK
jgi:large subunit ribosomal protein L35